MDEVSEALPCAEKLTFDTKQATQATATTAEYQHGAQVRPYLCRHCHLWHLASKYND